jgi:hypothetical protein
VTLDLLEAAAFLGYNPEVLRRNLDKWGVPYARYTKGGHYRFTEAALSAYILRRQAPSEEESCHSEGKEVATGTSVSKEYDALLKRKSSKTPRLSKTG